MNLRPTKIDWSTVVDGATWRGGDAAAFATLLATADQIDPRRADDIAVLQLLQQPEVYRGGLFRFAGSLAKCESVDDHHQLWIKPADGTLRPLLAIVRDVPDDWPTAFAQPSQDGPQLTVAGRFIKRLAYRSVGGVDVTPVLIGRIVEAETAADPPRSSSGPAEAAAAASERGTPGGGASRWLIVIAVSTTLGLAIAAGVMLRTRATGLRLRQLRRRRQLQSPSIDEGIEAFRRQADVSTRETS